MAHHKSALKRLRQSKKRKIYNRQNKKALKLALRSVREAENQEIALEKLRLAQKIIDKLAAKRIIHKNNAANHTSSLVSFIRKMKTA